MAKTRISALAAITALALSATDVMPITDTSVPKTNKVTMAQLRTALFAGGAGYSSDPLACGALTVTGATSVTGTLTATGLVTANAGVSITTAGLAVVAGGLTVSSGTTTVQALTATTGAFGTTPATTGVIRIPNASNINARNAANSADQGIMSLDASDRLSLLGGTVLLSSTTMAVSATTTAVQALTATTGAFSSTVSVTTLATVNRASAAGLLGYYAVSRNGTPLYYLGQDASDNGAILNGAATQANLWWTDTGSFTARGDATLGVIGVGTTARQLAIVNSGATAIFATEGSAGGTLISGASAYETIIRGNAGIAFSANAGSMHMQLSSAGALSVAGDLTTSTTTVAGYNFYNANFRIQVTQATGVMDFKTNGVTGFSLANGGAGATITGSLGVGSILTVTQPSSSVSAIVATPTSATYTGAAFLSQVTRAASSAFEHFYATSNGVVVAQINGDGSASFGSTVTGGASIVAGASLVAGAASVIAWNGRSQLLSPADGVVTMSNNATTSFSRLVLGGTSASFPAFRVSSAGVEVRLGDDSAYSFLRAGSLLADNFNASNFTGAAKIIGGTTGVTIRNNADNADNFVIDNLGNASARVALSAATDVFSGATSAHRWTGRSMLSSPSDGSITIWNNTQTGFSLLQFGGTTSSFPALKRNGAGLDVRKADDSSSSFITASSFIGGSVDFSTLVGTGKIVGGTTGTTIRNNADSADNLILTDAGVVTIRAGLTVTTGATTLGGGVTISTGGLAVTGASAITGTLSVSSTLTLTAAASKIVPGATSFSHRNNADSADNLLITDAGAVTIRSTLGVTSDLAVNTNKFTVAAASGNAVIAGTLTVASTVNVTLGALTVSTGAITATANSINAGSFVSAIGGKVQLTGNAFTVSVSTSATNCTVGTNTAGALALVNGSDGTNRFADLVFYSQSTVTVLASQTLAAAPAARTYTCASGGLKLAMGSGTYNVYAQELQNTTNA